MELKIYDGANEIGGSKIYVREDNHGLFLDFGLNFNVSALYFKEFISMRSIRGINDPLEMGLLPRIKAYRKDLIPSDISVENFESIPVDAVLLSHAHVDHYGMIGYLDFSIPLVASPETLTIIKANQDSEKSDIGKSAIYSPLREEVSSSMPVLLSMGNKKDLNGSFDVRELIPTESLSKDEIEFLKVQSGKRSEYLREHLEIGNLKDLPFKIQAYPVDHSIYGSVGYVVEAESKKIAYTGDLRLHGELANKTMNFAKSARESDVLIVEGTRVAESREHNYTTERDVFENSSTAVAGENNLVIVDFSSRNFERLNMFSRIAEENSRRLVVSKKDAYMIRALLSSGTKINTENIAVYDKPSKNKSWWENEPGYIELWDEHMVGPLDIRKEPGEFMLAFSLYDMPNLMDIKSTGGLYLYSSTEPFNEEMVMDFVTLNNYLNRYGLKSIGFRFENGELIYERGYHASGHASEEELREIICTVEPDIIVPVHTTNPSWFTREFGEKARILKNGDSMTL